MKINTENSYLHGDCFEILKDLPDQSFNAVITDPPYLYLDHHLDSFFDEQVLIEETHRLLSPDSFFVFFGRGESYFKMNYLATNKDNKDVNLKKSLFKFTEELIWDKINISSGVLKIGRCHENISLLKKGNAILNKVLINKIENDSIVDSHRIEDDLKRILSTIQGIKTLEELNEFKEFKYKTRSKKYKHSITMSETYPFVDSERGCGTYRSHIKGRLIPSVVRIRPDHYTALHPTQKPIELMKRLILLTTKEDDLVLDPFGGSATTAIACLETNRRYLVIEKNEDYYKTGLDRITKWHNDKLNNTGCHQIPDSIERIKEEDETGQLSLF
jgi:site-specific DNA-methyltransferase (adenine-specific)